MSKTNLIVLRGPSGSGKSTVAKALRAAHPDKTALIEQDYVRRIVLKEKEVANGANIDLLKVMVLFAFDHGYHVILEGILARARYQTMLAEIVAVHPQHNYWYYFDVSLDETVRRHKTKPNRDEFGATEMKAWWLGHDALDLVAEQIIAESSSVSATVERILRDVGWANRA